MSGQRLLSYRQVRTTRPPGPSPAMSASGKPIVVLANRAPLSCERSVDGRIKYKRSAGGLVTALEPLVEACSGTWVAHGAGNDDDGMCVDDRGGLDVPPANLGYRLRHVRLSDGEYRGYYNGFANEALWPLCHAAHVEPIFRPDDFRMYRIANARFAAAVVEEAAGGAPVVLVQDYHFALAPRLLRQQLRSSAIAAFWHIPWPHPRVFRICPWGEELLDGLLGSHVVGFQTPEDCANFLETVASMAGCDVDREHQAVHYRGQSTRIRAYPVGIEWANEFVRTAPAIDACRERAWRDFQLGDHVRLAVGIDRLDYTKGINQKFLAIERLLEIRPDLRGRFVFVQVAEPSRDSLPAYRTARSQLVDTSERVNLRFGTSSYRPIILVEAHHEPADVYRLYRAAELCYVGSLHDGMNLVAKEFVCARDDERGVLVLSRFAGASLQLDAALIVNPYALDECANALARALSMSDHEQAKRMRRMRSVVATTDTHWWADQIVAAAGAASDRRQRDITHAWGGFRSSSSA
jgi:trehalose 6-phosphate synthase